MDDAQTDAILSIYNFKECLAQYSNSLISENECIDKCLDAAKNTLLSANFDLSEMSRQAIDGQRIGFEIALKEDPYLTDEERAFQKAAFTSKLGEFVAEKWAVMMAKSFHPIASISDHQEKASAALKWADHYFEGLTYLRVCQNEFSTGISNNFIARHAAMTEVALNDHCHAEIQNRMATMQRQYEKNPVAFERRVQGAEVKVESEGEGILIVDKEIDQLANDCAQGLLMHWPEIDEKKAFLQKCIWTKFTFRTFHLNDTEKLFAAALKEKSS
jgi:hypothetical protein